MTKSANNPGTSEGAVPSFIEQFDLFSNKSKGKSVSILDGIIEMRYFESIMQDTLRVTVVYADTGIGKGGATDNKSVLEGLPLVGSEKATIRFKDNNDVSIGKDPGLDLYVNKVTPLINETTKSMISLELVSKEYIMNEKGGTRVNTRMDGKISDSVDSIIKNNLKTEKKLDIEETENNFNFIPNNKKPIYILEWLSKKSVPSGGDSKTAGFFFWETSDGFHFKSIEKLLSQEKKKSIVYNETAQRGGESIPAGYEIKALEYRTDNKINIQKKFQMGAYSTRMILFNPFSTYYEVVVKDAKEEEESLELAGKELPVLNKEFDSEGEGNNFSRTTYHITDTGTLASGSTQEQIDKSREENFEYRNIENEAIRRYNQLFSAETTVTLPGDFSLHAGDMIFVDGPQLQENPKNDEVDKQSGGKYIISDICHFISSKGTYTKMSVIRDSFGREGSAAG